MLSNKVTNTQHRLNLEKGTNFCRKANQINKTTILTAFRAVEPEEVIGAPENTIPVTQSDNVVDLDPVDAGPGVGQRREVQLGDRVRLGLHGGDDAVVGLDAHAGQLDVGVGGVARAAHARHVGLQVEDEQLVQRGVAVQVDEEAARLVHRDARPHRDADLLQGVAAVLVRLT